MPETNLVTEGSWLKLTPPLCSNALSQYSEQFDAFYLHICFHLDTVSFFFFFLFFWRGDCIGFSLLPVGFLQLPQAGATLHCGARASQCSGFPCCGAQAPGVRASVAVVHGLSCSTACGIFLDQGWNPCPHSATREAPVSF